MIKYYTCKDGFVENLSWSPNDWINVECPTQAERLFLLNEIGVPESFLESVADPDERPRFDREDEWLMTIIRIPLVIKSEAKTEYRTIPFGIMTKSDVIVTLSHAHTEMIPDFIEHSVKRHIKVTTQPDFVLRLIFSSTYWYQNYLKDMSAALNSVEPHMRKSVRNEDLFGLMDLQKGLVFFSTSLRGNSTLTEHLDKLYADDCAPELLEDVGIELTQAQNTVDIYMKILGDTVETFASVISNNMNEIMKKLTGISIVMMIPTLIASFYGMNVDIGLPDNPTVFWLIVVVSMALASIIFFILRRLKWL